MKIYQIILNPLVPSAHKRARIAKISILILEGHKKFPMSVATMSIRIQALKG